MPPALGRTAAAALLLSGWLLLLLAGWSLGGVVHGLLAGALVLFPWGHVGRGAAEDGPQRR